MSAAWAMSLSIMERLPVTIARRMLMPTSRDCTPCLPSISSLIEAPSENYLLKNPFLYM